VAGHVHAIATTPIRAACRDDNNWMYLSIYWRQASKPGRTVNRDAHGAKTRSRSEQESAANTLLDNLKLPWVGINEAKIVPSANENRITLTSELSRFPTRDAFHNL
jgi:hypothetical protein